MMMFALKMMNLGRVTFTPQTIIRNKNIMDYFIYSNNNSYYIKPQCYLPDSLVRKTEELCIENEELCIENEELCIENDEICRRARSFYRWTVTMPDRLFGTGKSLLENSIGTSAAEQGRRTAR